MPQNKIENQPLRKKRKIEKKKKKKGGLAQLFQQYRESKNAQIEKLKKKNRVLEENGKKLVGKVKMMSEEGKKLLIVNKQLEAKIERMKAIWSKDTEEVHSNENEEKVMDCNDVQISDDTESKQRENDLEDGEIADEPNGEEVNREIDALLDGMDDDGDLQQNDENRPLQKR